MTILNHNDQVFINGKIFTSNPTQPYASAMIVRDGKIIWIGEQSNVAIIDGEYVDLKGQRVLPGLIDSHLHPLWLANCSTQIACTPPLVYSIDDLIGEIRKVCTT